jgi:hypothetical protein
MSALVIAAGSTAAEAKTQAEIKAESTRAPLQWTQTSTPRQNAALNDIATHPAGTWAVGGDLLDGFREQRPLALRWEVDRWRPTPQPVTSNATLESVAVTGANDVWAVGEDRADPQRPKPLALHWNGKAWQVVPGPAVPAGSFSDVVVGPDGNVWATGWAEVDGSEHAVVYRYADGTWQPLSAGLEQSINGNTLTVISENDAWLGLNAGLAHFDGKSWRLVDEVPADGSQIPTAMAAAGPNDIWLVGVEHTEKELPLLLHYDGVSWTRVPAPRLEGQLYDVALRNGRPVAVGERFEEADNIVTARPLVLEHRGSRFVRAASPTDDEGTLTGIAAAGSKLWAGGLVIEGEVSAFTAIGR